LFDAAVTHNELNKIVWLEIDRQGFKRIFTPIHNA